MKKQPLVSIITACYNGELYISRCIEKVLEQDYNNVEMIIVNDGSVDKTEEIILGYKEKFKERGYRLIYIKQENQGVGGATNNALKHINGDYFTLCDADNFYISDYLSEMVSFFQNNSKFSIVRCDGFVFKEDDIVAPISTMAGKHGEHYNENLFENCLFLKNFHLGGAMFKTSDFDKINPMREIYPSRHGQNWQILLPMLYYFKSGYIDKPLCCITYRKNSVYNAVLTQDAARQYERTDDYCKIIQETFKLINMPNEECEYYLKKINLKYARQRLIIAAKFKDIKKIEEEYTFLKKEGEVTKSDKNWYYRGKNKGYDLIFRFAQKLKSAIRKIKKPLSKLFKRKQTNANSR
ncbi:MAG: glycosyltransferase family 2 protein [Clostridia bacterium]|nr:glycosyltransferase family 2 protein [Clostridia bacterium]